MAVSHLILSGTDVGAQIETNLRRVDGVILLAGMNEMFSLPIGASQHLNCDRVKYKLVELENREQSHA